MFNADVLMTKPSGDAPGKGEVSTDICNCCIVGHSKRRLSVNCTFQIRHPKWRFCFHSFFHACVWACVNMCVHVWISENVCARVACECCGPMKRRVGGCWFMWAFVWLDKTPTLCLSHSWLEEQALAQYLYPWTINCQVPSVTHSISISLHPYLSPSISHCCSLCLLLCPPFSIALFFILSYNHSFLFSSLNPFLTLFLPSVKDSAQVSVSSLSANIFLCFSLSFSFSPTFNFIHVMSFHF